VSGGFDDPGSLRRGRFHYLPVAPGRMEFAIEVRRAILDAPPQVVAVELPFTLEEPYTRAVARLPEISVLVYPEDKDEGAGVYVPVEPAEAVSAVHRARPTCNRSGERRPQSQADLQ
jgi:hypothetical protein